MKEKLDQEIIFEYFHHIFIDKETETKERKYPGHVKYSGIK